MEAIRITWQKSFWLTLPKILEMHEFLLHDVFFSAGNPFLAGHEIETLLQHRDLVISNRNGRMFEEVSEKESFQKKKD